MSDHIIGKSRVEGPKEVFRYQHLGTDWVVKQLPEGKAFIVENSHGVQFLFYKTIEAAKALIAKKTGAVVE